MNNDELFARWFNLEKEHVKALSDYALNLHIQDLEEGVLKAKAQLLAVQDEKRERIKQEQDVPQ